MTYKIIIVDDEQIERQYLNRIFSKYPYEYEVIGEAQNGKQAVELATNSNPDVVIMDINLPLLDGLEASRIIKKFHEATVIILNSAFSEFEFAQKAIQYDLDGYLLKPSSEQDIIGTVERSLQKRIKGTIWPLKGDMFHLKFGQYPVLELGAIVEAIELGDLVYLDEARQRFMAALMATDVQIEEYLLFLMNAFFSILKVVDQIMDVERSILNEEYHFMHLINSQTGRQVVTAVEDFLEAMVYTVRTSTEKGTNLVPRIKYYLENHFKESITLERLAEMFYYSTNHIARRFKAETGSSILEYLKEIRLNHARKLLEGTDLPIHDVALQCGYLNISHFNRVFKGTTGYPPNHFRKES